MNTSKKARKIISFLLAFAILVSGLLIAPSKKSKANVVVTADGYCVSDDEISLKHQFFRYNYHFGSAGAVSIIDTCINSQKSKSKIYSFKKYKVFCKALGIKPKFKSKKKKYFVRFDHIYKKRCVGGVKINRFTKESESKYKLYYRYSTISSSNGFVAMFVLQIPKTVKTVKCIKTISSYEYQNITVSPSPAVTQVPAVPTLTPVPTQTASGQAVTVSPTPAASTGSSASPLATPLLTGIYTDTCPTQSERPRITSQYTEEYCHYKEERLSIRKEEFSNYYDGNFENIRKLCSYQEYAAFCKKYGFTQSFLNKDLKYYIMSALAMHEVLSLILVNGIVKDKEGNIVIYYNGFDSHGYVADGDASIVVFPFPADTVSVTRKEVHTQADIEDPENIRLFDIGSYESSEVEPYKCWKGVYDEKEIKEMPNPSLFTTESALKEGKIASLDEYSAICKEYGISQRFNDKNKKYMLKWFTTDGPAYAEIGDVKISSDNKVHVYYDVNPNKHNSRLVVIPVRTNAESTETHIRKEDYSYNEWAAYKPVIYLYGYKGKASVDITFNQEDEVTAMYPKADKVSEFTHRWDITAKKDGTLSDGRRDYGYLYYESTLKNPPELESGFIVHRDNITSFLEDKLDDLGLTNKEACDFITYWLPRLSKNEYNFISFNSDLYEDYVSLSVKPKAEQIIRVYMWWHKAEKEGTVKPQTIKKINRKSGKKTVVEWGGSELPARLLRLSGHKSTAGRRI